MKILVTGGTGYIGSHTVVELIEAGHEVEILDNLYNSDLAVLDKIEQLTGKKPKFHRVDIRDADGLMEVFENGDFEAVIHFAGLKAVAESVEKPLEYYENNVGGTINLLECMQEFNVKKIIFSSSATVYGDLGGKLASEDMPTGLSLSNPYGRTKYMIEEILKDLAVSDPTFSITILRYFNPIGAHPTGLIGEVPGNKPNNLMPIIMNVASGKIPELSVCGDDFPTPDGTAIRDYIHVVDLARGHLATLEKMSDGVQVYNLGSGKGTSVLEMVKTFEKVSDKPLPHKIAPRRAGDLAIICANPSKANAELGWQVELSIEDAMRDTLKFLGTLE